MKFLKSSKKYDCLERIKDIKFKSFLKLIDEKELNEHNDILTIDSDKFDVNNDGESEVVLFKLPKKTLEDTFVEVWEKKEDCSNLSNSAKSKTIPAFFSKNFDYGDRLEKIVTKLNFQENSSNDILKYKDLPKEILEDINFKKIKTKTLSSKKTKSFIMEVQKN